MDNDLNKQIEALERAAGDIAQLSKRALGFHSTIEYAGIRFDVSRRFVIADLSPLAFFHLVEHIHNDTPESAVERLYERLLPLLSCRHDWTLLKRSTDDHVRSLSVSAFSGKQPHTCKRCTAYALGVFLPTVGREL